MAVLDAKLPAWQASTKAVTPTKAEAKTLEGKAPLVIDGGGLGSGIRVLLKNQTTASQNGLFEVSRNEAIAGTGKVGGEGKVGVGSEWTLTRTADADSSGEVAEGMLVPVEDGATNRKTSWIQRTPGPIEVGVTAQTFESLVAGALGAAGGDLTGSYSEPSIAEAVIDNSMVEATAGIKASKLDLKGQVASTDLATSAKELAPQLPVPANRKQIVGQVNAAGEAVLGQGFTCTRTATGKYTIKFSEALATAPVVTGVHYGDEGWSFLTCQEANTKEAKILVRNGAAELANEAFNFYAMG